VGKSKPGEQPGGVNLLWGERGPGQGLPLGGGDRGPAGDNYSAASPTRRDRQQPWEGGNNIPGAITQQDALDVRSNVSLGEGYDQGGRGDRGEPEQGRAARVPAGDTRDGGLATALRGVSTRPNDTTIKRELEWQGCVGGDPAKLSAFKDQVLNQQVLCAFAFMKGKLPAIHLAHSIGAFFGLSGMATDVQGKQIAFVGDRSHCRQPIPFILPPQNSWTWARVRYLANTTQYLEHYAQEAHRDKLWTTGAGEDDLVEIQLPRLLLLPTLVAEFVVQQGGACLPHTLRAFVTDYINSGKSQVLEEKWQLVLDWCLAASQAATDGSSILNLGAPEPALCQDEEFLKWCGQRLATTLGRDATRADGQPKAALATDNIQLVERIIANMGRSFVEGVQALAPTIVGATRQGWGTNRESGEGMGGENVLRKQCRLP
jgi:hypothetical protein